MSTQEELRTLISNHCRRRGKYAVYEPGWSDQQIASTLGYHIQTVALHRKAICGRLKKGPNGFDDPSGIVDRVTHLEDQVRVLKQLVQRKIKIAEVKKPLAIAGPAPKRRGRPPKTKSANA